MNIIAAQSAQPKAKISRVKTFWKNRALYKDIKKFDKEKQEYLRQLSLIAKQSDKPDILNYCYEIPADKYKDIEVMSTNLKQLALNIISKNDPVAKAKFKKPPSPGRIAAWATILSMGWLAASVISRIISQPTIVAQPPAPVFFIVIGIAAIAIAVWTIQDYIFNRFKEREESWKQVNVIAPANEQYIPYMLGKEIDFRSNLIDSSKKADNQSNFINSLRVKIRNFFSKYFNFGEFTNPNRPT